MTTRTIFWIGLTSVAPLALALGGGAGAQTRPSTIDTLSLGRNTDGEPCTARTAAGDQALTSVIDKAYPITCRSAAASRPRGTIRVIERGGDRASVDAVLNCGEAREASVKGVGTVAARRCFDKALGLPTIAFEKKRGGRLFMVSANESVLGPAEEALRVLAGYARPSTDPLRESTATIAAATLAPGPAGETTALGADFDPAVALADGIDLNHKGLHVQASRTLNDALSRLPAEAPAAVRAELQLEAALADSNIRFTDSAKGHFDEADVQLTKVSGSRAAFLQRKRDAYVALDLLNQRKFDEALVALDRLASAPAPAGEPLRDPATVRVLNQPPVNQSTLARTIAVPQTGVLDQLVLDSQASWARSVALLARNDIGGARVALDRAIVAYRPLMNEQIDPKTILWLGAQIDRQQGRLQSRAKDYPAAIASFDRALTQLRQSALRTAGTGTEPTIAETALERAGIIADQGGNPVRVRREYDQAVDALIAANQQGGSAVLPPGLERYLNLLIAEAKVSPTPDTQERFFRAVQAVGEPAVARQLNQLRNVVASDPAIGNKVRYRQEVEREVTRLSYEIADVAKLGQSTVDLERRRADKEAELIALSTELNQFARYRSVDDRPATIAEVRQVLRPGEGFLKVVELNRSAYAIFVDSERSWIYPVASKARLDVLADAVRNSIDGRLAQGDLVAFKVAEAHELFALLAGPATDAMLKSTALVIDPAGPLQRLPASVLVTDKASVDRYAASRKADAFDYSKVSFLASRAAISTAVSPRSFLNTRALAPSAAKQPFLGLGEHLAPVARGGPDRQVNVGFGCTVSYDTLANQSRQMDPISRKELRIASEALGVANAPEIVGAAFSDTAVEARTDLGDFEVLHFATHGLEEGQWGCTKSPPALVTSFGDGESDGLLSFSEIARLPLDANLVVLSACDTAAGVRDEALARRSGQEDKGSTLEGLVRAFLAAQSRAVMATLWEVSAESDADLLMRSFYSSARQRTIGGSLQTAQGVLIKNPEFSHPYYWGAYIVVGDSTKMMLSGSTPQVAAVAPVAIAR